MDELLILQKLDKIKEIADQMKLMANSEKRSELGTKLHLEVLFVINTIDRNQPAKAERCH